ncbi:hypothetical protein NT6N_15180 [Oceaniferula spumae]|uniref:Superoxide dismutase copper/zinc binding domain-containing protein n=2 Tax=Oceaniferula spumae TaxID=2979115 RepID=A0AAT9FKK7_9BACT
MNKLTQMTQSYLSGVACTGAALLISLTSVHAQDGHADHGHSHDHAHHAVQDVKQLVAVLTPTSGNTANGTLIFTAKADGKVEIVAEVSGLKPNAKHAFHIHEFGDIRAKDGTATGGHYNPEGHDHALPDKAKRHAGDLGNLEADAEGKAKLTIVVDNISLFGKKNPIVGRAIIVHVGEDDGGQPTGNAGARIAQGVIGIAKPE